MGPKTLLFASLDPYRVSPKPQIDKISAQCWPQPLSIAFGSPEPVAALPALGELHGPEFRLGRILAKRGVYNSIIST